MNRMDIPAAEAAKLVKRVVRSTEGKGDDAKVVEREVSVAAKEVFSCAVKEDGTLVVVTIDGQKLFGIAPKAEVKAPAK